jgi:perosamine synthetase
MGTIPLFDCSIDAAGVAAAASVLSSGQLASGPAVAGLEADVARFLGRPHVVAFGDLTHALAQALELVGVGPSDEVLTLAYNCLSSNAAIATVGAVPVWVDIDPDLARISIADCAAALTPRTKALVVYHVAGYPADLTDLRAFCDRHGLALIEDANNALGAEWDSRRVGTVGDFAAFSFYANRQANGIEGAALACPDQESARRAARMRRFGIDAERFRDRAGEIDPRCDVPQIGMSSSLNHVNATLARQSLRSVEERLALSRRNVDWLRDRLHLLDGLRPIDAPAPALPAYWAWLVRCARRDDVMTTLKQRGIQCSKLHQPNDVYTGFRAAPRELPGTRRFMDEVLALPCGWWLGNDQLEAIAQALEHAARA